MKQPQFLVRVWGARGSLPAPAAANCDFGTDSCCVEMRCGPHVLVFDTGSGASGLGNRLAEDNVAEFDIFYSHCHFDHIIGLPFMQPMFNSTVRARLYAGHFEDGTTCREMADRFMSPPLFPLTPDQFRAKVEFHDFRPPETLFPVDGISVGTVRLNHPNGAVGYRVNFDGRAACYVTDTEHMPGEMDAGLLELIRGAGLLIYDCMYTDAEFSCCRGYGHSTWEQGVRLCEAAGVPRLVIFHHRPGRDDTALRALQAEAQARFPGAVVAGTGLEFFI